MFAAASSSTAPKQSSELDEKQILTATPENLLAKMHEIVANQQFPQLVKLACATPEVLNKVRHKNLDEFWNQLLAGEYKLKPYPQNIPLKPHHLDILDEKFLAPDNHPFCVIARHYCAIQAIEAKKVLATRTGASTPKAAAPAMTPKAEVRDHKDLPIGATSDLNIVALQIRFLSELTRISKPFVKQFEWLQRGEKLGDFYCMGFLAFMDFKVLDEKAKANVLVVKTFIDNLFARAARAIQLHWASGFVLYAQTCFRLGRYYAKLLEHDSGKEEYIIKRNRYYQLALVNITSAQQLELYCENMIYNAHFGRDLANCSFFAPVAKEQARTIGDVVKTYQGFLLDALAKATPTKKLSATERDLLINGLIYEGRKQVDKLIPQQRLVASAASTNQQIFSLVFS
jgi:hypothetical protein